MVRWPNDVHVGPAKLAGILVETTGAGRAIFGIGVNTAGSAADAPEPLRRRVATIPDLTGGPLPRETLLAAFLPRLLDLLAGLDADPAILPVRYGPLCGLTGHEVTLHVGDRIDRGLCRGIAVDGGLLLDTAAGLLHCLAGSLTAPADVWPANADG
jgi:BirA family biotin operon repressor/biotin-[acetyl-CoA-carboxylase] ligase